MGVLLEPISQNRHKMAQIRQISIKIQVPQKEFKIAKFNKPDIDNQMSGTCGQYEPLYTPHGEALGPSGENFESR